MHLSVNNIQLKKGSILSGPDRFESKHVEFRPIKRALADSVIEQLDSEEKCC